MSLLRVYRLWQCRLGCETVRYSGVVGRVCDVTERDADMFASFPRRAPLIASLVAVMVLGGLLSGATAQEELTEYTGCLTRFGSIIKVAEGGEPLRPCRGHQTLINWNVTGPPGPPALMALKVPPVNRDRRAASR